MNNQFLDWAIFLGLLSAYLYGQYFLAKRLIKQEKITTKDVTSELKQLPVAYGTGVVGFYLLAVYIFGDKYKTTDLIIAVALTVAVITAIIFVISRFTPTIKR
jgi:hypothetical protein